MVRTAKFKGKIKKHLKIVLAFASLFLVIIAAIIAGLLIHHNSSGAKQARASTATNLANQALAKNNKPQALKYVKQALASQPNNVGNLELAGSLTKTQDPSQSKQYYAQALDVTKQQIQITRPNATAVDYWAVANLAMQAGENEQAKTYYQDVIAKAQPSNVYEQGLVSQSYVMLSELSRAQ